MEGSPLNGLRWPAAVPADAVHRRRPGPGRRGPVAGMPASTETVTAARITPGAFPDPPLLNSVGVHQPWALRAIVQLDAGTELTGLGETYGDAHHLALLRRVAARLTGHDPFDLAGLAALVAGTVGDTGAPDVHGLTGPSTVDKTRASVYGTFEVACLDLQGKLTGRPVYALLGGKVRDRVPYSG